MTIFTRFKWVLLLLVIAGIGALSPYLKPVMVPDNSLSIWFLENDPNFVEYQRFLDVFGNDEIVLLMVDVPPTGFDRSFYTELHDLEGRLESLDGVFQARSIASLRDSYETDEGLEFNSFFAGVDKDSDQALMRRFSDATTNRVSKDKFVSSDGKHLMVWVELAVTDDFDNRRSDIVHSIQDEVNRHSIQSNIPMGGLSVIYTALNDLTQKDVGIFFSVTYLLIFIALWVIFRKWVMVFASILIVTMAMFLMLGIYGALGYQINMVTAILPTVIIIVGLADIIHVPAIYEVHRNDHPEKTTGELIVMTFRSVFLPCFLTTITTMFGFLSLSVTPISGIREFGTFAAVGLGAAFFLTFIVMAIALPFCSHSKKQSVMWMLPIFDWIVNVHRRHSLLLIALIVLSLIIGGIGASRLIVDTYTLGYFPASEKVIRDHERILDTWGRYAQMEMVLTPRGGRSMISPDIIEKTEEFLKIVKDIPVVRDAYSITDVYRRMEEVFAGKSSEPTPLTPAMVDQLSLMLDSEDFEWDRSDSRFKENVLSLSTIQGYSEGRITLVGEVLSAKELSDFWALVIPIATDVYGETATLTPGGYGSVYSHIVDYIMSAQIQSFFYTLGIIFIIMLLWTRSFALALISLGPNIFPVILMLGTMGFLGIALDLGTAIVAAIVLGISIDDTIHFIHYWRKARDSGSEWEDALRYTLNHAGRAAMITSILLLVGFPIMMLSGLKTVFYFGFLTTISAVFALVADLFLLPQMLRLTKGNV